MENYKRKIVSCCIKNMSNKNMIIMFSKAAIYQLTEDESFNYYFTLIVDKRFEEMKDEHGNYKSLDFPSYVREWANEAKIYSDLTLT